MFLVSTFKVPQHQNWEETRSQPAGLRHFSQVVENGCYWVNSGCKYLQIPSPTVNAIFGNTKFPVTFRIADYCDVLIRVSIKHSSATHMALFPQSNG